MTTKLEYLTEVYTLANYLYNDKSDATRPANCLRNALSRMVREYSLKPNSSQVTEGKTIDDLKTLLTSTSSVTGLTNEDITFVSWVHFMLS